MINMTNARVFPSLQRFPQGLRALLFWICAASFSLLLDHRQQQPSPFVAAAETEGQDFVATKQHPPKQPQEHQQQQEEQSLGLAQPPNIVILLADNLGYNDVGIFGAPTTAQTPNIDRLGHEGMKFTHWNSAAHLCSASRASLLTGQYYPRLGIYPGVFHPNAGGGLLPPPPPRTTTSRIIATLSSQQSSKNNNNNNNKENQDTSSSKDHLYRNPTVGNYTTIAMALKERGYATSIVGKWHLGHLEPFLPVHHGFDEWLGVPYHMSGGSVDHHTCITDVNETMWLPLYHNQNIVQQPVQLDHLAQRYAHQAVEFMTRNTAGSSNNNSTTNNNKEPKPFFLFMSFSHVHQLCAPRDYPEQQACQWSGNKGGSYQDGSNNGGTASSSTSNLNTSNYSSFVDAVEEMDWIAGQILQAIDHLGIANNTLVWFTSDNGPWVAEKLCSGSKGPFEGRWLQENTPPDCTACPHDYVPVHHHQVSQQLVEESSSDTTNESSRLPHLHECYLPGTDLVLEGVSCGHDTGLGSVWEANLRMPALVRWPRHISQQSVTALPVSTLDLLPTILAVVDDSKTMSNPDNGEEQDTTRTTASAVPPSPAHKVPMDGINLSPLLLRHVPDSDGELEALEALIRDRPLFFWRDGFQEGPLPQPFGRVDVAAMKMGKYKLWFWTKSGHYNNDVEQYHDPPVVFDILADPAEAFPLNTNSTELHPIIEKGKALVRQHKAEMVLGPPFTLIREDRYIPCVNPDTKCRTMDFLTKKEDSLQ